MKSKFVGALLILTLMFSTIIGITANAEVNPSPSTVAISMYSQSTTGSGIILPCDVDPWH